jgi:GT2 family glycosyltransferase
VESESHHGIVDTRSIQRKVAVIVPTWKRGDLLRRCLESLRTQSCSDFELVIVSNGAGEWAGELAREFGAKLVGFEENRGFAAAVNAGIGASDLRYLLVLNDDAELEREWLQKTVALLDATPEISFCCGKILQADGHTVDNAGDALSMAGAAWRLGYGRPDGLEFDAPRQLICVSMTAALFRRAVFEKIGNLDERFISYLEDVDFSIRLWRAGLRGRYLPQAVARHHGGASLEPDSPGKFRLMTRNQIALLAKHYPFRLWLRLAARIQWAQLLWFAMAIRKGLFRAYLAGLWQAIAPPRSSLVGGCVQTSAPWSKGERKMFVAWLRESERAIYEDIAARPREQQDAYWRWYFALFRPDRNRAPAVIGASERPPSAIEPAEKADPSSLSPSPSGRGDTRSSG